MATRNLFDRGGLALNLHDEAPAKSVDLLHNTIWGTEGGTRYRHYNTRDRITKQLDPQFLTLHKGDRLLGILGFSRRKLAQPAGETEAFYIRYLSMMSSFQRQNPSGNSSRKRSDGLVKKMVGRLMNKPEEMNVEPGNGPEKAMFYAFVELENERSMEMTQAMGFEPVGKFSTILFSRFSPKWKGNVEVLKPEDLAEVKAKTLDFYSDHALFTDKNIYREGTYYVYRDGGKIVAGMKAHDCHWKVVEMSGLSGKLILSIVPKIPLLNRLFNPSAFKFAAFEGLWHLPGYENRLFDLMETALADLKLNTGMLWLDRKSPLDPIIRGGHLGILQHLNSDVPVDVIARFIKVPESIQEDIRQKPIFISAYDST